MGLYYKNIHLRMKQVRVSNIETFLLTSVRRVVLSSSWLLNMKRLVTLKYKQRLQKQVHKATGSSPIATFNNKGKKKELECMQLYYLMIWTQEERRRTLDLQTLGLQGCCVVYLFELFCTHTL